jgi:hypothetical protein
MRVLYVNPERHDYLHATLLEGLTARDDIELWTLNVGNYGARAHRCLHGDVETARTSLPLFDAVVFGTEEKHARLSDAASALLECHKPTGQRWVLVDSGDFGSLPIVREGWRRLDGIVKRELYLRDDSWSSLVGNVLLRQTRHPLEYQFRGHRLVPFPNVQCNALARPTAVSFTQRRSVQLRSALGVRCEPIGLENRLVQSVNPLPNNAVTCTLAPNIAPRKQIIAHLAAHPGVKVGMIESDVDGDHGIDLVETGAVSPARSTDFRHNAVYLSWLHRHRASVSFPGAGFDTARFWEILGSGSLLISKRISLNLPIPFEDGVHYVGFDSLSELDAAIAFAVSDSHEVDEIRGLGHRLAVESYSSAAMAERLVQNELRRP